MSLRHIAIGVAAGIGALTASLFVGSVFSLSPLVVLLFCLVGVATLFAVSVERKSRAALRQYWERKCTGRLWVKHFPSVSTASIREFLNLVAEAFIFPGRHLKFAPDDRVFDIYHSIYPDRSMPDACELETLVRLVAERYGVDIAPRLHEKTTLGELYAQASAP